jgi:hypothetical protein
MTASENISSLTRRRFLQTGGIFGAMGAAYPAWADTFINLGLPGGSALSAVSPKGEKRTQCITEASNHILGGQHLRIWDSGLAAGFFHTYENFQTPGAIFSQRRIDVFLPRGYEESEQRYPTIYMHDGDTSFFKGGQANQSWDVGGILEQLYHSGMQSHFIVVAIWPVDRNREYTHVRWSRSPSA